VPDLSLTPVDRNFLSNYGSVTMEECRAHAKAYMMAKSRAAKDSQMMVNSNSDSLTRSAKAEMFSEADKYTINGYAVGLCFLKLLISKAQVETIATVMVYDLQTSNKDC
jgi:hypothetical protein